MNRTIITNESTLQRLKPLGLTPFQLSALRIFLNCLFTVYYPPAIAQAIKEVMARFGYHDPKAFWEYICYHTQIEPEHFQEVKVDHPRRFRFKFKK